MAWQVGILATLEGKIGALPGWLPVWAWATPDNLASAEELRTMYSRIWHPEPALTLITIPTGSDLFTHLLAQVSAIEEHHPNMSAIRVFTPRIPQHLIDGMQSLGYRFTKVRQNEWVIFFKTMHSLPDVAEIELDATRWESQDDFYDAVFKALGAPEWHGRNFNALSDSIGTGAINSVEVPYRINIRNVPSASGMVRKIVNDFAELIRDLNADGCPVELHFELSDSE